MICVSVVSVLLSSSILTGHSQRHGDPFEDRMLSKLPPVARRALLVQDSLVFRGTRVVAFRKDGQLDTHKEFVTKDHSRLRIEFPGDSKFSGQIIVESSTERRHFFPNRNEIHVTPPRKARLFEHLFQGGWRGDPRDLRFLQAKGDRVAGLGTVLIKVMDGPGNILQTVNIEPRSGLVLKRELYDMGGAEIGHSEFTQVSFHPDLNDSLFVLERMGSKITTPLTDLYRLAEKKLFLPAYLGSDSGFVLDSSSVKEISGQKVLASEYVSPKGHLTVFQLAQGVDPKKMKRHAPPQLHAKVLVMEGRTFALVSPLDDAVLDEAASHLQIGTKHP